MPSWIIKVNLESNRDCNHGTIIIHDAIVIEEVTVQTTLRDGVSFRRLTSRLTSIIIGLKYLHQPSNFELNILTLT